MNSHESLIAEYSPLLAVSNTECILLVVQRAHFASIAALLANERANEALHMIEIAGAKFAVVAGYLQQKKGKAITLAGRNVHEPFELALDWVSAMGVKVEDAQFLLFGGDERMWEHLFNSWNEKVARQAHKNRGVKP